MATVPGLCGALRRVMGETAEEAARATGFVRRRSKLTGAAFVRALVFGWLNRPDARLEELAQTAAAVGVPISAQGLDQRFGERAAAQGGMLVWRKGDSWTAYTDGHWTWVNGPVGVQRRLNADRFGWEAEEPPVAVGPPRREPPVTVPTGPMPGAAPSADVSAWPVHDDPERTFRYPPGWSRRSNGQDVWYASPQLGGFIHFYAPYRMGIDAKPADFIGRAVSYWAGNRSLEIGESRSETINGFAAERRFVYTQNNGGLSDRVWVTAIKRGRWMHYVLVGGFAGSWDQYEPTLLAALRSYYPKGD